MTKHIQAAQEAPPLTDTAADAVQDAAVAALRARGLDAHASARDSGIVNLYVTLAQFTTMRQAHELDLRYAATMPGRVWGMLTLTDHNRMALGI